VVIGSGCGNFDRVTNQLIGLGFTFHFNVTIVWDGLRQENEGMFKKVCQKIFLLTSDSKSELPT